VLQQLAVRPNPRFVAVWSEWIIAETWRVLSWQWVAEAGGTDEAQRRHLAHVANEMLRYLIPAMRLVSIQGVMEPAPWPELRDKEDAPIWATAVAAGAQYVVSHNIEDFPPLVQGRHVYSDVEYLTAVEFIEDVLDEDVTAVYGAPLRPGATVRSRRAPRP
jgi:hypothetical protein